MDTNLVRELKRQLARYLRGELTLNAFIDWFSPATWDIDETNDFGAQQFSYEIEHRLAEFSNGHWDVDELNEHLGRLIPEFTVSSQNETISTFTGRLVAA